MAQTVLDSATNQVWFADKREMARLTGLSPETLKRYRLSGFLVENVHWVKLNPRTVRYCVALVLDRIQNHHMPSFHKKAIENYQALLLSYQGQSKRK